MKYGGIISILIGGASLWVPYKLCAATVSGSITYSGGQIGSVVRVQSSRGATTSLINNRVLDLDGMSAYMALPTAVWFQGDFTTEAWAFIRQHRNNARLFDFGNGPGSDVIAMALSIFSDGPPYCLVFNNSEQSDLEAPDVLSTGVWTHVAFSLSGSVGKIFVNGQPVATNNSMNLPRALIRTNNYVGLSNWPGDDQPPDAMIDDFAIWSRALSQSEITDRMGAALTGHENGLVGCWDFNAGTAKDITTNGHNGILNSGATIKAQQINITDGSWTLTNLPTLTNHSITAYLDSNQNQSQDYWEAYGDYSNNPIYLTNDTTGVNIVLADPDHDGDGWVDYREIDNGTDPYNPSSYVCYVTGTVSYAGSLTGAVHLVSTSSYETVRGIPEDLGGWQLTNRMVRSPCYFAAFRDSNGNATQDSWEACGSYSNNPVFLTNDLSGVNIVLSDPDHDGDGQFDWIERLNGTDPYNPASFWAYAGGSVAYSGGQTGLIRIAAVAGVFSRSNTIATIGAFIITNMPTLTNYIITAYRDSNGNLSQDYWEAYGTYSNNPVYLTNYLAVVNLILTDPDHDGDGQVDWIERQNRTDPYNSSSRVVTITGVISGGMEQPGSIRAVALRSSPNSQMQSTNNIMFSTVVTGGWFAIQGVPTLSNYWVKAFIDKNANGIWSPVEPIGDYAGNPIYLTNDYSGADIALGYGDWDGDGINDDEEAYVLLSNPSNSLSPILVDDNGPNDPLPGDPEISDPSENGTISHPYDAIQEAINVATNGSVIVVMDGTYSGIGNKDIGTKGKAITIQSRYGYNSTTIDVASVHNGFVCLSNETVATIIKGFTIHTWASFFGLSGILCNNASPAIEDCRIWDCGVAGILCTNGANPTVRRTVIEANTGGVRCYGSSPVFDRCLIQSNYSGRGAGVLVESNSHPYFVNTLIAGNRSTNDGGGIYIGAGCNPTGINCTVAFNVASNRGSALSTAGTPLFKNVIIWGNSDPASDPIDLQSAATFTYSCVQEFHPGTGNQTNNPVFVSSGDYQLQFTSPCLDVGTAVGSPTNDYAGQLRPMDGDGDGVAIVDIGAYERTNYVYVCTQAYTHYVSAVSTNPKIPYTNWATAAQHIQSAINVAFPGALVLVSNGTYSTGGAVVYGSLTNRVAINKAITVRSVNGPVVTVIRGAGPSGDNALRCAYVGTNALLSGFTLTNGATRGYGGDRVLEQMGGGAWLEAFGVLSNCVITGNAANDGGGGVRGGTLYNCTIVSNSVGFGYCSGGGALTSTLNNCTIIGNSAWGGGGAASSILNGCTISSNWVQHPLGPEGGDSHGGGVSDSIVSDCVLNGNRATGSGAGGGANGGILSNCTIIGNSASFGGGVCDGTLYSCALLNNSAESGGGAVGGTLYNCSIFGNTAFESGGGVYALWSPCTLYNSIVFFNDAPSGANHSGVTFNYSCTTPSPGGAGNIADEPQFVNVGSGNYRLQSNSPCINRGINQSWMTSAMDLDGNPRLYAGGVVDMGAYEFQGIPTLLHPELLYDASYGMVSNRFGFNINWNSGQVVVVDANTNLNTTNWLPIATNTVLGVPWYFSDPRWTNYIGRFYRLRSQ